MDTTALYALLATIFGIIATSGGSYVFILRALKSSNAAKNQTEALLASLIPPSAIKFLNEGAVVVQNVAHVVEEITDGKASVE